MNLYEHVKEIEEKYQAGQNIFRRHSVGFLLERISQLEQSAQHGVQSDECLLCGGTGVIYTYDYAMKCRCRKALAANANR